MNNSQPKNLEQITNEINSRLGGQLQLGEDFKRVYNFVIDKYSPNEAEEGNLPIAELFFITAIYSNKNNDLYKANKQSIIDLINTHLGSVPAEFKNNTDYKMFESVVSVFNFKKGEAYQSLEKLLEDKNLNNKQKAQIKNNLAIIQYINNDKELGIFEDDKKWDDNKIYETLKEAHELDKDNVVILANLVDMAELLGKKEFNKYKQELESNKKYAMFDALKNHKETGAFPTSMEQVQEFANTLYGLDVSKYA